MFLLRNNAICGQNDWFFVDFSLGKNECWMVLFFVINTAKPFILFLNGK